MQIALEPDFVVTEAMPVLDSRMRSLGLSENQVSVVMAVRRKGKNLTHALQHRTRKNTMLEQLQVKGSE